MPFMDRSVVKVKQIYDFHIAMKIGVTAN